MVNLIKSELRANIFFKGSSSSDRIETGGDRLALNARRKIAPVLPSFVIFLFPPKSRTGWIRPWELLSRATDIIIFSLIISLHLRLFKRVKSKWKLHCAANYALS